MPMLWWLSISTGSMFTDGACLPRAMLALLTTLGFTLLLGPRLIRWLAAKCPERIATDSATLNALHRHKSSTPSMGGVLIVAATALAIVLFCSPQNLFTWLAIGTLCGFALLGVCDDLCKRLRGRGVSAKTKFMVQTALSAIVATVAYYAHHESGQAGVVQLPFIHSTWSIQFWYIPFATIVLVAVSNSVNLTDGLDGLAGGCLLCSLASLAVLAGALSSPFWSAWLGLPSAPAAGEMVVVAAAAMGALLAFLWFNCHPAQVFMGDSGSLPLGALLGLIAIACRQELLLLLIGGVFVVEALSVILQVTSFRLFRRRLFRCAPLHHHFQFGGWPESKIVVRFWLAALACASMGLFGVSRQSHGDAPIIRANYAPRYHASPAADILHHNRSGLAARYRLAFLTPHHDESFALFGNARSFLRCRFDGTGHTAKSGSRMNILPFQNKLSRARKTKDHRRLHVALSGGATCGHLFPGVAVAEALLRRRPNTRITFIGNKSAREKNIIEDLGWQYIDLPCQPAPTNPAAAWRFFADHVVSSRKAIRLIEELEINAVVGLGGYASVPMARAAAARHVPLILLEQNAVPGLATRWLANRADHICLAFASAQAHLSTDAAISVIGNPVRRAFYSDLDRSTEMNGKSTSRLLLVLGGSGGAGQLNEQVPRALYKARHCLHDWHIVHQAGSQGTQATRTLYQKFQLNARVEPFIEDLAPLVRAADLVICRAGGTTLAELAAAGAPAIMIPWGDAKDNHQRRNADAIAKHEAGVIIDPRDLEGRLDDALAESLTQLLPDRDRRLAMGVSISRYARPKAAQYVASTITELVDEATRVAA